MIIGRRVSDIRSVLKEAASYNSIKYRPEKGVKHYIYIPYTEVEVVDDGGNVTKENQIIAMMLDVHEWVNIDGRYRTAPCLKDVVREENGVLVNDGSCPFCDRIADGWEIYKYRLKMEEGSCGKTGNELKSHLDNVKRYFVFERKSKEPKTYIYMLVAQFKTDAAGKPVLGEDSLPEYDLKIMKMSLARLQKIKDIIENAGTSEIGCEIVISYPNEEDARVVVSQSTISVAFPTARFTTRFNGLEEKILKEAGKFVFNGIEKAFPEWSAVSTEEAKRMMDEQFRMWDSYKKELLVNPEAKYLEYTVGSVKPALEASIDIDKIFESGRIEI
jgi:hypothetical protein